MKIEVAGKGREYLERGIAFDKKRSILFSFSDETGEYLLSSYTPANSTFQ
jgi:hypothetical protein